MTALILIDFQKGFSNPRWGRRNNLNAEENAARLLNAWRVKSAPLFHVRHVNPDQGSVFQPGSEAVQFKTGLEPKDDEIVIEKSVNSAFIGTDLEKHLRDQGVKSVVIAGLTTPHCVSTTCRMAANLGFQVTLAEDACAAFSANADMSYRPGAPPPEPHMIHDMAVAHLHGEFVTARKTFTILGTLS